MSLIEYSSSDSMEIEMPALEEIPFEEIREICPIVIDLLTPPSSPRPNPEIARLTNEVKISADINADLVTELENVRNANSSLVAKLAEAHEKNEALGAEVLHTKLELANISIEARQVRTNLSYYQNLGSCSKASCDEYGCCVLSCGCKTCATCRLYLPAYGEKCQFCNTRVTHLLNLNSISKGSILDMFEQLDERV